MRELPAQTTGVRWEHRRESFRYRGYLGEIFLGEVERFRGRRWRIWRSNWLRFDLADQEVPTLTAGKALIEEAVKRQILAADAQPAAERGAGE